MSDSEHFSAKQVALIGTLSTHPYPTMKAACRAVGVSYATGRRWNDDPVFAAAVITAVEDSRAAAKASAERIMLAAVEEAAQALVDGLHSEDGTITLRSSLAILERILGKVPDRIADADGNSIPVGFAIDSARSRADSEV